MANARTRRSADQLAGAPPRLVQGAQPRPADTPTLGPARSPRKRHGINLRAVAEVLEAEGMDPTEELVRLLRTPRQKVVDPETGATRVVGLDDDTRARVHLELLGYVQPKLKAVELRVSPGDGMTDEQLRDAISAKLAALGLTGGGRS